MHELDQKLIAFGRDGVEIYTEHTCSRILDVDLQQQLIILESSPIAPFLAQYIHEFKQRHEQTDRECIIDDILLHQALLDELAKIVAGRHLVNVEYSLNQIIGIAVVALEA